MAADRILGLNDLLNNFAALGVDMQIKQAPRIVVAGGRVLVKAAKAEAQHLGLRKTGALIKNIAMKRERQAPEGTAQYNIGVRHGRDLGNGKKVIKYLAVNKSGRIVTKRQNDPFYWRFLQFPTKYRDATPFLEKGLDDGGVNAINAMEAEARKILVKVGK